MKRKIFMTGATGFVGRQLTKKLLDSGHQIRALVEEKEECPFESHANFEYVTGNLGDKAAIKSAMADCYHGFHIAAYARPWAKDPRIYYDVNVEGTKNILDVAIKASMRKLVITSSCSITAPSNGTPSDESTVRKIPLFNHYDFSKQKMEELVGNYTKNGFNAVLVSPPRIYGPGLMCPSNPVTDMVKKYLDGDWKLLPGNGDRLGSYVYIDDVVQGHILALKHGLPGEKYILAGDNRKFTDVFDTVGTITGIHRKLRKIPLGLILVFSYIQTKISNVLGRQPLLPYDWTCKLVYDWALSGNKAARELGYTITTLEEGMAKTVSWIRENQEMDVADQR